MHLGTFPNGRTFATFVMSRNNYPLERMTVPDHDAIFTGDRVRVPSPTDVEGSWTGNVVFVHRPDLNLHNQFNPPVVHARFGAQAVIRTLVTASTRTIEHHPDALRLTGAASTDEIRSIDSETLIGRRIRTTRPGVPSLRYVLTRKH
jgi:hypothetical protein